MALGAQCFICTLPPPCFTFATEIDIAEGVEASVKLAGDRTDNEEMFASLGPFRSAKAKLVPFFSSSCPFLCPPFLCSISPSYVLVSFPSFLKKELTVSMTGVATQFSWASDVPLAASQLSLGFRAPLCL